MTSGLARDCREERYRLLTMRARIDEALGHVDAFRDPHATKLCAVLALVEKAIEILQPGDSPKQTGASAPAGGSNG